MASEQPHDEAASTKRRRLNNVAESEDAQTEGPACQSCRKRKAKCSRQRPCSNCLSLDLECIYDDKRSRPGMRPGAVESLNRRVEMLEQMFVGQGILLKPLLDRALNADRDPSSINSNNAPLADQLQKLKNDYLHLSSNVGLPESDTEHCSRDNHTSPSSKPDSNSIAPQDLLAIVDWYFDNIHPWIPILHVQFFRANLQNPSKRHKFKIILDAIVSLCLRFQPNGLDASSVREIGLSSRHSVIIQSMEKFSVESLQALVIIAFDIVGSGRGPSAWSVVGSMTRTVEQLRLSVEEDEEKTGDSEYLIRRLTFLRRAESWAETEERRRVFWNVFLMDRFCSIATGWNNSLTSADVQRRLPCEGAIWQAGRPVRTPFFGIAGRSSTSQQALTPSSERHPADDDELNSIGGFAFCIEATENLNLVTSFFLQHPVAFHDVQEMQLWLMRFKELDLRLVKWRLFLPTQWRNASVLNQDGIMDPNLTLAHMTHNTAVIQLHQCIAYPAPHLRSCPVSLPSTSSSETCVAAASEISTIAEQFLQQSAGITNPQFSFCLFIAARVLLAHATYNATSLHPAFEKISVSLADAGRRWGGPNAASFESNENLALRFSKRLEQGKRSVLGNEPGHDPTLDIRQPVYSDQVARSRATSATPKSRHELVSSTGIGALPEYQSPDSISLAFPPLPFSFENFNESMTRTLPESMSLPNGQEEFNMIFDDQYQQMLRVSTFAGAGTIMDVHGEHPLE